MCARLVPELTFLTAGRRASGALLLSPLLAVLLCGSPLAAQDATTDKPKYGTFRLGPMYLSMVVPFSAGVDSNVYNTPDGVTDNAATITPTLHAVLPLTRRARVRTSRGVVPQYFFREASERHTDVFGDVRGELDLGPFQAFGGIGGGRYRERFSLEIDERMLRRSSSVLFGGTMRMGHRATLTGSQSTVRTTFDPEATFDGAPVSESLDRDTLTRRANASVPVTRKTAVTASADFIEDRFVHAEPGQLPRVDSQRYAVGLEFGELAFLTGSVAAGVRHFGRAEGVAPYDGLYLSIRLGGPFILGSRFILASIRDVMYSALRSEVLPDSRNTYVSSTYRADVMFEMPLRLEGRVNGGYGAADYLLPGTTEEGARRRDESWTVGGALLRHFGRHLNLGLSAQRDHRTSPVDGHTYVGVRLGLAGEIRL